MAIDWADFSTTDTVSDFLSEISQRTKNNATMTYTGDTNLPPNARRINGAALQTWDGADWSDTISAATLDHNSLLNYDANEHADITADETLSGTWRFDSGLRVENEEAISFRDSGDSAWQEILSVNSGESTELKAFSGGGIQLSPNNSLAWQFGSSGRLFFESETVAQIIANSSDGSDNLALYLAGGGSYSEARGATFTLSGNEHVSRPGQAILAGGDVSTGDVVLRTHHASAEVQFQMNGSTADLIIDGDGDIIPGANAVRHLGTSAKQFDELHLNDLYIYGSGWSNVSDYRIVEYGSDSIQFRVDQAGATDFYSDFRDPGTGGHNLQVEGVTLEVPFTGVHVYPIGEEGLEAGDAVKLDGRKIVKCREASDRTCIGLFTGEVVGRKEGDREDWTHKDSFGNRTSEALGVVASLGDTVYQGMKGAKVCDEGGPIEAGDYLVTSSRPGYLMKTKSRTLLSEVVAYAPEEILFVDSSECKTAYVYLMR